MKAVLAASLMAGYALLPMADSGAAESFEFDRDTVVELAPPDYILDIALLTNNTSDTLTFDSILALGRPCDADNSSICAGFYADGSLNWAFSTLLWWGCPHSRNPAPAPVLRLLPLETIELTSFIFDYIFTDGGSVGENLGDPCGEILAVPLVFSAGTERDTLVLMGSLSCAPSTARPMGPVESEALKGPGLLYDMRGRRIDSPRTRASRHNGVVLNRSEDGALRKVIGASVSGQER